MNQQVMMVACVAVACMGILCIILLLRELRLLSRGSSSSYRALVRQIRVARSTEEVADALLQICARWPARIGDIRRVLERRSIVEMKELTRILDRGEANAERLRGRRGRSQKRPVRTPSGT